MQPKNTSKHGHLSALVSGIFKSLPYKKLPKFLLTTDGALAVLGFGSQANALDETRAVDLGALRVTFGTQNKTNLATKTDSELKDIPQTINIITQSSIKNNTITPYKRR